MGTEIMEDFVDDLNGYVGCGPIVLVTNGTSEPAEAINTG